MKGKTSFILGLLVLLAGTASADTLGISGGILIAGTEPGDGGQVYAPTIVGSNLVFPNLRADIVTPGCTAAAAFISCPLAGFQELVILGGDGDDVIELSGISGLTFAITALGGRGNDVLVGTPGNVKLFGGLGDDVLISMPGNCFSRGPGNDIVLGSGCDAGPEPVFAPLPRPMADSGAGRTGVARNGVGARHLDRASELPPRLAETLNAEWW